MNKENIVSFDFPYPPNYGGIIDVFYKLKNLHQAGIKIHLHYFADEQKNEAELNQICESIHYYSKSFHWKKSLSNLPFRMLLRANKELLNNLKKNEWPILFEGLYTAYFSQHKDLRNRKKFLRCHNAEGEYFEYLSTQEPNILKKFVYEIEAMRMRKTEKNLNQFNSLFVLNEYDQNYFSNSHPQAQIIPIFHKSMEVSAQKGLGNYVLFHGNLSVVENLNTALWIKNEIAPHFPEIQFVITGRTLSKSTKNKLSASNIHVHENPTENEMNDFVSNAQIILLKTNVPAGVKLKLIDSLAYGRHIISDKNSVQSMTDIEPLVHIAENDTQVRKLIQATMHQEFTTSDIINRNYLFEDLLSNKKSTQKLISAIFKDH